MPAMTASTANPSEPPTVGQSERGAPGILSSTGVLAPTITATNMADMRLTIYTRTSTLNGAGQDSLSAQEDTCRAWAEATGHAVVSVFRDEALSGGLGIGERPGLRAALVALEDNAADGIVVHRVDRLARELHVQEVALAHAWSVGDHVHVFEASEGGEIKRDDPNDPQRRFLRQVMGAAAELERGMIRARLHGGRRRKAQRGGYVGGPRLHRKYGYHLEQGEYVPDAAEQEAVSKILSYRSTAPAPLPYAAIADVLNAQDIAPPSGAAWYAMTVRRIAVREQAERAAQRPQ